MKKILSILLIGFIMFLPINVQADENKYKTLNLEEVLTKEGISHDLSNYKETDNQAIIYLFRGDGCTYCKKFLNFLNSIVDDYGKYFKVVSYEVWYDKNNSKLMKNVAAFLDEEATGVPYIIIGDKTFPGYSEVYDDQIKEAIKAQYDSKNSYDVFKEMQKAEKEANKSNKVDTVAIIVFNIIFTVIATTIIVIFNNFKSNNIKYQLDELKEELLKMKKKEKVVKKSEK